MNYIFLDMVAEKYITHFIFYFVFHKIEYSAINSNLVYMEVFMKFFSNFFKGIAIGAGAILPGISSGVLCVIFGIYEKLLNSILHFFKDLKNNIVFLTPILIGCGIGIILFGNVLNYFLYQYPIQTKSIFIGFILSSVFSLVKQINSTYDFKFHYIIYLIFALSFGIGTVILENYIAFSSADNINFLYLIICGFCMSIGVVIPGVSSTIILMLLGVYSIYLSSISNLFLPVIIPIGIGLLVGGFLFMKIIKYLLDNFYAPTFFTIIGFTLGSVFVLTPSFSCSLDMFISVLCIILGFFIASLLEKNETESPIFTK